MYDTILRIAHDVLVIGGALSMIVFLFVLIVVAFTAVTIHSLIRRLTKLINSISETIITPFSVVSAWLSKWHKHESEPQEEEETKKASTTRRKKTSS